MVTVSEQAMKVLQDGGVLPTSVTQSDDAEWAPLDQLFSGRPEPAKFPEVGATVSGVVVNGYTRQKRKFGTEELLAWDDGSPKMEAVIELNTPDGMRSLYVGSWRMENALQTAFQAAGVRGPRPGGRLVVRWSGEERVKDGLNPAKVFEAAYEPPGRRPLDVTMPPPQTQPQLPFGGDPPF